MRLAVGLFRGQPYVCFGKKGVAFNSGCCPSFIQRFCSAGAERGDLGIVICCGYFGRLADRRRLGHAVSDLLFTRIDTVQDRPIKKAFQQPDQNQKIDDLGSDSNPVDRHV